MRNRLLIPAIAALYLLIIACGTTTAPATDTPVGATPRGRPSPTIAPPTNTPAPSPTTQPTPTPIPLQPVQILDLPGQGETVTDNIDTAPCYKTIVTYHIDPNPSGLASLIAHIHQGDQQQTIINTITIDTGPATGQTWLPLTGGTYYLTTENTSGPWHINLTCHDGQAPTATGLDISGQGETVTPNFTLPTCNKSTFTYQVDPNPSGLASLILHLHSPALQDSTNVINALELDKTEPLTGEALQPVSEGTYFAEIQNASGPWTIHWQCKD